MPKVTLEFVLPEEKEEFEITTKAGAMNLALWDFAQYLRTQVKYVDHSESDDAVYESIREKFYEILNSHNVEL